MQNAKRGVGIVTGKNVQIGEGCAIWNYVVIGDNTRIGEGCIIGSFVDLGKDVVLGRNCNIQAHVTISNGCVLGEGVFIAPNSSLLNDKYPKSSFMTPPVIKDGAAIGGGVTILPSVTVGEKAVVGGGSVVTKDVAACTVVAGCPARKVMSLAEFEAKREEFLADKRRVN
ncbi:MAG: N-acetyltransferase [Candidatus Bathyarchaeota archaeon]|nr:N-acetyltransferase [Candidatus Bathyarchaeota archaeon]